MARIKRRARVNAQQNTGCFAQAEAGFSARRRRPFLGGIFFDRQLRVTDRLLTFVMRMLATGQNCLPAAGIGAVPSQLAAGLPPGTVYTSQRAHGVKQGQVTLQGGSHIACKAVVVATEGPEARRLLADVAPAVAVAAPGAGVGTTCLYFAAARAPAAEPILFLNGESGGIVNNCCVPSAGTRRCACVRPIAPRLAAHTVTRLSLQPCPPIACQAGRCGRMHGSRCVIGGGAGSRYGRRRLRRRTEAAAHACCAQWRPATRPRAKRSSACR